MIQPAVVEADRSRGLARSYLKLVRPKQWTKNGFVLAGVVFAEKAFSTTAVAHALLAFVVFCVLSGAVYAANDVLDVEEDRKHPLKRLRPVASEEISPRAILPSFTRLRSRASFSSRSSGLSGRASARRTVLLPVCFSSFTRSCASSWKRRSRGSGTGATALSVFADKSGAGATRQ